jgi:hypothetical protein
MGISGKRPPLSDIDPQRTLMSFSAKERHLRASAMLR